MTLPTVGGATVSPSKTSTSRRSPLGRPTSWAAYLATFVMVAFLAVPVLALLFRVVPTGLIPEYMTKPIVVEALRLSLITSFASLFLTIVFGTPAAYLLARRQFRFKSIVETVIDLPVVLPPAVAGIALLFAFGRRGVFGPFLSSMNIELAFTVWAVILAQFFVAAPFYIRTLRAGLTSNDLEVEGAAQIDGAGSFQVFCYITLPMALPSVIGGLVLAWAKAIGEFGATIFFAGSFMGRTQTLPLAVYQALESDLNAALVISAILVMLSFVILAIFRRTVSQLSDG